MDREALTPRQLEERGLGAMFGQPPLAGAPAITPPQEGLMMAQLNFNRASGAGEYVPEEDVIETLPDGRTIQVAVKGAPMSMADAMKAGLVKDSKAPAPSEPAPAEETAVADDKKEAPAPSEKKPQSGPSEKK